MTENTKRNLFQPFVQGDLSYTKQYQGTGLGLAISKQLVNIMGGKINVETKIGKGSRFYFRLKLEKSEKLIHHINEIDIQLENLKVLFIDDNALNREITYKMLSNEGIEVITAESGNKGIEILKEKKDMDLILLDVHMPEIDGIETLKIIKDTFKESYPVLMFTSVDLRSEVSRIKEYGANDYLMKPVTRKELLEKIKKIINDEISIKIENDIQEIHELNNRDNNRILIVEDNNINMQLIKIILKRIGNYEMFLAENGLNAIEIFEEKNPNIVFLDIQMPIMNGFEAFEKIKEICKRKNWKMPTVIAMTAYAMEKDKEKILKSGMDIFLPKPISIEQVKEALEKSKKIIR